MKLYFVKKAFGFKMAIMQNREKENTNSVLV